MTKQVIVITTYDEELTSDIAELAARNACAGANVVSAIAIVESNVVLCENTPDGDGYYNVEGGITDNTISHLS